jgi:hypothetical protein
MVKPTLLAFFLTIFLPLFAFPLPTGPYASAQVVASPDGDAKKDKADPDEFWFVRERRQAAGAAEVIGAANPWLTAALRLAGKSELVWLEPEYIRDTAPKLNADWLAEVKDRRPLPNVIGKAPDERPKSYDLYCQALVAAWQSPLEVFANSAKKNAHVKFAHLYNEPWKYRGEVIHIEGKLVRLRRLDTPHLAWEQGVPQHIYEGWVFGETSGSHPWWLIFPTIPASLQPAEKMDRYVSFDGYFYGLIRYTAEAGQRDTPLLIGPAIVLKKPPPAPEPPSAPISGAFLTALVSFFFGVVALVIALSWRLRRSDQRVRHQLNVIQAERTIAMLENQAAGGFSPPEAGDESGHPGNGLKTDDRPGANKTAG